jgi:OMF family outer membrane factor
MLMHSFRRLLLGLMASAVLPGLGWAQTFTFPSLDSLYAFADAQTTSKEVWEQQGRFARLTELAAKANVLNLRGTVNYSETDNLNLPVTFLPGEIFGGPAGSVREIRMGQQYVGQVSILPMLDVLNPAAWGKLRSADVNTSLTYGNIELQRRTLHESIAAAYFNILSLQDQLQVAIESCTAADSLLTLMRRRQAEGLIRQQDVNNAQINSVNVEDLRMTLVIRLEEQLLLMRTLLDIPADMPVEINSTQRTSVPTNIGSDDNAGLEWRISFAQMELQRAEWRASKLTLLPTLSLVGSFAWQKNSNEQFWDPNATWISSQYIGLRLSVPFPPEATRWSQISLNKVNYEIARAKMLHEEIKDKANKATMDLELERTLGTFSAASKVAELKAANYEASLINYQEGLLSPDQVITSFTDLLNARLASLNAGSAVLFAQERIRLWNGE